VLVIFKGKMPLKSVLLVRSSYPSDKISFDWDSGALLEYYEMKQPGLKKLNW